MHDLFGRDTLKRWPVAAGSLDGSFSGSDTQRIFRQQDDLERFKQEAPALAAALPPEALTLGLNEQRVLLVRSGPAGPNAALEVVAVEPTADGRTVHSVLWLPEEAQPGQRTYFLVIGMEAAETPIMAPVPLLAHPSQRPKPSFPPPSLSIALENQGSLAVRVGEPMTLTAYNPLGKPTAWKLDDPDRADLHLEATQAGTSSVAVTPRRPGPIYLSANVDGERAHGLIAALDPGTSSMPVPRPLDVYLDARQPENAGYLVTTEGEWEALARERLDATTLGGSHVSVPLPSPLDWSTRSLVVVLHDQFYGERAPVVTHRDSAGIHVVMPQLRGWGLSEPAGYLMRNVTVLSIPKAAPGTKVSLERLVR